MRELFENTGLNEKAGKFESNIMTPDYLPYDSKQLHSLREYIFDDTGWEEPANTVTYENYDGEI